MLLNYHDHVHVLPYTMCSWHLIDANDVETLNVKLISLIAHANVQSRIVVLSSHRSMASAIPYSLNSRLSLAIQQFVNSWLMYGSVLCLSKTASKTPLTRLTLHRGRTTQRNILSYHLNCPEKYIDTAQHIDCSTYGIHVRQSFTGHTSSSF